MANEIAIYNDEQVGLIKQTVAVGTTDSELALFLHQCSRTGLDPLSNQIHCIKRGGRVTIQTGIDGFRLIADRTEKYAPGETTYKEDGSGNLISATVCVKKLVAGTWHEVKAEAFLKEYEQSFNGQPSAMWKKMPHTMLAKCAESLALRKAFPAELSGLYTDDEMRQADATPERPTQPVEPKQIAAQPASKPNDAQMKRDIAANLEAIGVPKTEIKEIAPWLIESSFGGDIAAAHAGIATWIKQGFQWDADARTFRQAENAATA